MSHSSGTIKARPDTAHAVRGDGILHFAARRSLLLSSYVKAERLAVGLLLVDLDGADAAARVEKGLADLARHLPRGLGGAEFKLLGLPHGVAIAKSLIIALGGNIAAISLRDDGKVNAFLYAATGRLRVQTTETAATKVSLANPGADDATRPVEPEASNRVSRTQAIISVPAKGAQPVAVDLPPDRSGLAARKIRVLIVDDSRTIRQLLAAIIARDPELEVAGTVENPTTVEQMIVALKPDVMTLDINMPEMDGVAVVEQILPKHPIPTIMITALSMADGDQVMRALELGAVDYIQKPSAQGMQEAELRIREKIKMAARARVRTPSSISLRRPARAPVVAATGGALPLVAIGASTGGTEAIRQLLLELPKEIPPIVIVQHIPPVFSTAFAKRLNELCPFEVLEAKDGDAIVPGRVLVAPGGLQMRIIKRPQGLGVSVSDGEAVSGHRPSVDVLFTSVAEVLGSQSLGVILTGMGADGAKGLLQMREKGARTIAQDEETCVVFGMPGVAVKLGAAELVLPLGEIAAKVLDLLPTFSSRRELKAI